MRRINKILNYFKNKPFETYTTSTGLNFLLSGLFLILVFILSPFLAALHIILSIPIGILELYTYTEYKIRNINKTKHIINIINNYEEELNKSPLYFEDFVNNSEYNLKAFIMTFFHNNSIYDTLYANNSEGIFQCMAGRRRSLGDIYRICKYYYPDCTLQEVLNILIFMLDIKLIGGSYCNVINKFVFHTDSLVYKKYDTVEYTNYYKFNDFVEIFRNNEDNKLSISRQV